MINLFKFKKLKKKIINDIVDSNVLDIKYSRKGIVFKYNVNFTNNLTSSLLKEDILKIFKVCKNFNLPIYKWEGSLDLSNSNIENLYGFPKIITKSLYLNDNNLKNFKGDLLMVGESLNISNNDIKDLRDFPILFDVNKGLSIEKYITLDYNPFSSLTEIENKICSKSKLSLSIKNVKNLQEINWSENFNLKDVRCDFNIADKLSFKMEYLLLDDVNLEKITNISKIQFKTTVIYKVYYNNKRINTDCGIMLEPENIRVLIKFFKEEDFFLTKNNFITKMFWNAQVQQNNDSQLKKIMIELNHQKKTKKECETLNNRTFYCKIKNKNKNIL